MSQLENNFEKALWNTRFIILIAVILSVLASITLFILGTALRSDGIRAQVFKQERSTGKDWQDVRPDETLDRELEDAILTRARQLRITSAQKAK